MRNEGGVESDMRTLAEAERIRADNPNPSKLDDKAIAILAEARRIKNDEDRAEAVRKHMRGKGRKADVFAGEGSFAGKLKARRMAMEEGDPEGARDVFIK